MSFSVKYSAMMVAVTVDWAWHAWYKKLHLELSVLCRRIRDTSPFKTNASTYPPDAGHFCPLQESFLSIFSTCLLSLLGLLPTNKFNFHLFGKDTKCFPFTPIVRIIISLCAFKVRHLITWVFINKLLYALV